MDMKETVRDVAALAHLKFDESEIESFAGQFSKIVNYIGAIEELNLNGTEPLSHVVESENVFREDEVGSSLTLEEALSNAPKRNENFFKVPKVLE